MQHRKSRTLVRTLDAPGIGRGLILWRFADAGALLAEVSVHAVRDPASALALDLSRDEKLRALPDQAAQAWFAPVSRAQPSG